MTSHKSSESLEPLKPIEQQTVIPLQVALPEQQKMTELNIVLPERCKVTTKSASEIPPPPRWLSRAAYWFRLGFALVVLLTSLLSLTACGVNAEEVQWQPALKYFDRSLLEQIITENSSLTPSETILNKMQVRQLAKQPRLTLVDFNNAELCGQLGCLYVIYLETQGKASKVFSRYLHSELPEGVAVIELSDRTRNDLPCIVLNQLTTSSLTKFTLCYNGSEYHKFDSKTVKLKYD